MRAATTRLIVIALLLTSSAACGSEKDGAPSTPTAPTPPPVAAPPPPATPPPPSLTATVVIGSNNAFVPSEVRVLVGGRVTFVNQNNRPHDITSDPLHVHTDCPAIMEVGFILPGQTKQTGPLTVARTCGFHDHMQEQNSDLRGRIIIQ